MTRTDIRLGLPSKGILQPGALAFLKECGLEVSRPNPRQYAAVIPGLAGATVLFQRPWDIAVGVRQGTLDFGITGRDVVEESIFDSDQVLLLHDELGFGQCELKLAVPEAVPVRDMRELAAWATELDARGRSLRVATKFPRLTGKMLDQHDVGPYRLVSPEGTLEIAPAIGFADMIADLVSSGITLRDNHLRALDDGLILRSQSCLIANREALRHPEVLRTARTFLEFIEAHLRAQGSYQITANMRGRSAQEIAHKMFAKQTIGGLQGPTISNVYTGQTLPGETGWFAVNIIVRKDSLFQAVGELRDIGGSGVIVTPCAYIFEEEPGRYRAMLAALGDTADA